MTARFEVVGAWQPAGTLGGDCYDAFMFAPEVIGLSIADIAGKGLPAALLMSSLQAAVRAFALERRRRRRSAPASIACCAGR